MDDRLLKALGQAIASAQAASFRARKPTAAARAEALRNDLLALRDYIDGLEQRIAEMDALQAAPMPDASHPFAATSYMSDNGPVQTYVVDATGRLARVPGFTAEQCAAALRIPDLQTTVRKAVERRQRALGKAAGA